MFSIVQCSRTASRSDNGTRSRVGQSSQSDMGRELCLIHEPKLIPVTGFYINYILGLNFGPGTKWRWPTHTGRHHLPACLEFLIPPVTTGKKNPWSTLPMWSTWRRWRLAWRADCWALRRHACVHLNYYYSRCGQETDSSRERRRTYSRESKDSFLSFSSFSFFPFSSMSKISWRSCGGSNEKENSLYTLKIYTNPFYTNFFLQNPILYHRF